MAQIVYYVDRRRLRSAVEPAVVQRADRQLRQRARRLGRPADGRADRAARDRLQPQRHPHPLPRRPASMATVGGRADAQPEHGHPGVVELRAAAVRAERPRRRHDGRAAAALPGHRVASTVEADQFDEWLAPVFRRRAVDDDRRRWTIIARRVRRDRDAGRPAHRGRHRPPARAGATRRRADGRAGDRPPGQVPRRGRAGHRRPPAAAAPPRRPASTRPERTTVAARTTSPRSSASSSPSARHADRAVG